MVFLKPSLKSAFGHFQGQNSELEGPWKVIITLGVVRGLLCVIDAVEVLRDGCTEGALLSSSSPCFSSHLSSAAPCLFLGLWLLQPFSRGQSWLPFVGLLSHLALLSVEFLSPRMPEQGQLHCGAQQIFPTFPEEGSPVCVPFNAAVPLPNPRKGNSGNNFVWKELTHIRDPTGMSGGKALVGFEFPENLKALNPLNLKALDPLEYLKIYLTPHQRSLSRLGSKFKILPLL